MQVHIKFHLKNLFGVLPYFFFAVERKVYQLEYGLNLGKVDKKTSRSDLMHIFKFNHSDAPQIPGFYFCNQYD